MKRIGISVYPDFDDIETIKQQLDFISELGYTDLFTSIQLGDLGFENAGIGLSDAFIFLFNYCHEKNIIAHVDINDRMLEMLGATVDNLKPIYDLKMPIIRLDGGFTPEQTAQMTHNPYGIIIEENASAIIYTEAKIEFMKQHANLNQYYACHNFFPLNETGIAFEDVRKTCELYHNAGIQAGVFIGSLYSSSDLNAVGHGIVTVEDHRYKPSHIQAMEYFACPEFDYVIFGDSHPSKEEIIEVARVAKNDHYDYLKTIYKSTGYDFPLINGVYCVEIPVWLDKSIDEQLRYTLTHTIFQARIDQPDFIVRTGHSRGICNMESYLPIERQAYSLCICNDQANRYNGELSIPLKDLPPVSYQNVVGMVKPYGKRLVELTKYGKVLFVLREE